MKKLELREQVEQTAKAFYEAGGKIEINFKLPYVAINYPDGTEYFFQGEEAANLLNKIPEDMNEKKLYYMAFSKLVITAKDVKHLLYNSIEYGINI